jgi:hypothetical protein
MYALISDWIFVKLFLLFFEVDVAKEYSDLRIWTKKMSIFEICKTLL